MRFSFLAHPFDRYRIGDFLFEALADPKWHSFRAAVAFIKRSGTKHLCPKLAAFAQRGGQINISAGVDAGGTSREGLTDLLQAIAPTGSLYVFHNANASTFHPKIYLFKNDTHADLVIGSGNLTEGGLFTNYEASTRFELTLSDAQDLAFLKDVETSLHEWSTPKAELCYLLDQSILDALVAEGLLPDEVTMRTERAEKSKVLSTSPQEKSIFRGHAIPKAPAASSPTSLPEAVPAPAAHAGTHTTFLMTLQQTDVGVGQTTSGKQRRSPEIFIPLVCRDFDAAFWGWPDLFVPDPKGKITDQYGRGKMDREGVTFKMGSDIFSATIWYNPGKKDMRIRSEHIRRAGNPGDILALTLTDGSEGYEYLVDIIHEGTPLHAEYQAKCTRIVRNSPKRWNYL